MQMRFLLLAVMVMTVWSSNLRAQDLYRLEPITRQDVAYYANLLELNDEQKALAREFHDRYYDRFMNEFRKTAYVGPAPFDPGYREALRDNREAYDRTREEFWALDASFLEGLASLLNDEQHERMDRVLNARQRRLWRVGRSQLPGGNVDLVDIVESIQLSPDEEDRVEQVIAEFEPRLIMALQDVARARVEYYRIFNRAKATQNHDGPEGLHSLEARDEYEELQERAGHAQATEKHALYSLNEQFRRQLEVALSGPNADELRVRFMKQAYPEVFPDPASAERLYDLVESRDDLSDEQRVALDGFRQRFSSRHVDLSERMTDSIFRRRNLGRLDYEEKVYRMGEEWKRLHALGQEREDLNAAQIDLLRRVLTPQQAAELPEWDFERHPPRRPWDPNWVRENEHGRHR